MSPIGNHGRRIDEELVSVDSLRHVLFTRCGCNEVHVQRERRDPPDFTLTIDGASYPAEVTSIVFRQQYNAQCEDLANIMSDCAVSLGILSGNYALIISRLPILPKPTSATGRKLVGAAIAYIDSSQQQAACTEAQLANDRSGKISIAKVSADGASVGLVWVPPVLWAVDIRKELAVHIQHAVDTKKRKLQNAGIDTRRAILLLYDAFGYGEPNDAASAMSQISGYDAFHSIFWAASFADRKNITYPEEPGREGLFLFSHNPTWNGVGTVSLSNGT